MKSDFALPCVVKESKMVLYIYNESENNNKAMGASAENTELTTNKWVCE